MKTAHALERMQLVMRAVRGDGELQITFHKRGEEELVVGTIGNERHLRWWITSLMQVLKGCSATPDAERSTRLVPGGSLE